MASPGQLLVLFAALPLFAVLLWAAWALWTDRSDRFDGWSLRRAQTYPLLALGCSCILVFILAAALIDDVHSPVSQGLVVAAVGIFLVQSVLSFSIRRWGRPQRLVPPHLRGVEEPFPRAR